MSDQELTEDEVRDLTGKLENAGLTDRQKEYLDNLRGQFTNSYSSNSSNDGSEITIETKVSIKPPPPRK